VNDGERGGRRRNTIRTALQQARRRKENLGPLNENKRVISAKRLPKDERRMTQTSVTVRKRLGALLDTARQPFYKFSFEPKNDVVGRASAAEQLQIRPGGRGERGSEEELRGIASSGTEGAEQGRSQAANKGAEESDVLITKRSRTKNGLARPSSQTLTVRA